MFDAVLFDLDGTLLDTAPDLAGALNRVRCNHDLPPVPFSALRPWVSHGSFALVRAGFGLADDHPTFESLRQELLAEYHAQIADESAPFSGIDAVLEWLQARELRWGIVTNKPGWLTTPLLARVPFTHTPGCVVSGDTLPVRKPDPGPLLLAAETLRVAPSRCIYVGDAERDVEAGRRAGMRTLIASYGYLGMHDEPAHWGADGMVASPHELMNWLARALNHATDEV